MPVTEGRCDRSVRQLGARGSTQRFALGLILGPVLAAVVLAAGCSASEGTSSTPPRSSGVRASATTGSSTTTTATPTTLVPSSPPTAVPVFSATIAGIDPVTAQRMTGVSWRPGCPVPLEGLRLLHVSHWGFDGTVHTGELVVNAGWAERVTGVLRALFDARYPIERMQLVDDFGASDDASVLANNTSAFNCRAVTGGSGWSRHAYGLAIDLNPRQNPYVYPDGHLLDPASEPYRDRSRREAGMIHENDPVFVAFAAIGWRWGGYFGDTPDPQHFDTAPPG